MTGREIFYMIGGMIIGKAIYNCLKRSRRSMIITLAILAALMVTLTIYGVYNAVQGG